MKDAMTTPFTRKEIETGRKLFAGEWQFHWAAAKADGLPPARGIEIAFAGRSNVGKSSLINALTGRNALARTSNTPGRTQELIFFTGPRDGDKDCGLTLVDMPGYGYAAVAKSKVAAWTALIHDYLAGRRNLGRVYLLIDARHGFKEADTEVLKTLDRAAVSYQVALTKTDQIKPSEIEIRVADMQAVLKSHPAAFPDVLMTSSETGAGLGELRAAIVRLMDEKK
jgi:GTP-binding protein